MAQGTRRVIDIDDDSNDEMEVEIVEDSEPEREHARTRLLSESDPLNSAKSGRRSVPSASKGSSRAAPPRDSEPDSDSDIEILSPAPPTAAQRVPKTFLPSASSKDAATRSKPASTKKRRSGDSSGFTSASVLLKQEAKRTAKRAVSPTKSLSEPLAVAPVASTSKTSTPSYGDSSSTLPRALSGDEELATSTRPSSLLSALQPIATQHQSQTISLLSSASAPRRTRTDSASSASASETEQDSPGTAFGRTLSRFKQPEKPSTSKATGSATLTSTSRSKSFFAPAARPSSSSASSRNARAFSANDVSVETSHKTSSLVVVDEDAPTESTIPTAYLHYITTCPVCEVPWTTTKSVSVKHKHIQDCARIRMYDKPVVLELVERYLSDLVARVNAEIDAKRQAQQVEKTLFDGIISSRGKDVYITGVEKKITKKKSSSKALSKSTDPAGSDIENVSLFDKPQGGPVLYTQGGSALSQASLTQIQTEVDKKIKQNQKLAKAQLIDSNAAITPSLGKLVSLAPTVPATHGVGSKTWRKMVEALTQASVLKRDGAASDAPSMTSVTMQKGNRTGQIESYATSRHRLAEKARMISATRAVARLSPAVDSDVSDGDGGSSGAVNEDHLRPYRITERRSPSLIDQAVSVAASLTYSPWSLAGSGVDPIPDRNVSSSPSRDQTTTPPSSFTSTSSSAQPSTSLPSSTLPSTSTILAFSSSSVSGPSPTTVQSASLAPGSSSNGPSQSSIALQSLVDKLKTAKKSKSLRKAKEENGTTEAPARSTAADPPAASSLADTAGKDSTISSEEDIPLATIARSRRRKPATPDTFLDTLASPASAIASVSPKRKKAAQSDASRTSSDPETSDVPSPSPRKRKTVVKPRQAESSSVTETAPTTASTSTAAQAAAATTTTMTLSSSMGAVKKATATKSRKKAIPVMPDYESWSKEDLQRETGKYGYKPSGTKKVLVSQLVRVWNALNPGAAEAAAAAAADAAASEVSAAIEEEVQSTPEKPAKKSTTRKSKAVTDGSTPTAKRKPAKSKKAEEAEAKEKARDPGDILKEAILADEAFYLRLLRYEPICFTTFEELAAKNQVKISKVALRDWLDGQAIIFYYPQDTGRNASRHTTSRGRRRV